LNFLQEAEIPIYEDIRNKVGKILITVPFSAQRKNSAVAVQLEDRVRVFVKGAPEVMLYNSNNFFNEDGELTDLSHEQMDKINHEFIEDVTSKGLRCLAFGYKDFHNEDFE